MIKILKSFFIAVVAAFIFCCCEERSLAYVVCNTPNPSFWDLGQKPMIYRTNNLRKRIGSFQIAKGRKIKVTGKLMSEDCRPLKNVVVQIWHADRNGIKRHEKPKFTYESDGAMYSKKDFFVAENEENISSLDPAFTGAGSAITSSEGEFSFYTIMPGASKLGGKGEAVPHVFFNIEGSNLDKFQTVMLFPETSEGRRKSFLKDDGVERFTAKYSNDNEYSFDIVLSHGKTYR